jgi:hypothetical protein
MDILTIPKIEKNKVNKYSHHTVTVLPYKLPKKSSPMYKRGKYNMTYKKETLEINKILINQELRI